MKAGLVILVLLASTLVKPVQKQEQKTEAPEHKIDSLNTPEPKAPPVSSPTTHQEGKSSRSDADKEKWDWHDAIAPSTWSNWALVLVGIGATIAALCTLLQIRRQAQSMRYQTTHLRNSAIQARKAADAAKKSADMYEQTVRLTERADLLLDRAGLSTGDVLEPESYVSLKVTNFGRTRATNVIISFELLIPGVPQMPSIEGPDLFPITIGASNSQVVRFTNFIDSMTKQTFEQIKGGKVKMEFVGKITYSDVFDKPHTTECGGVFDPSTLRFRTTKGHAD